jgi:hypothetical protein
MKLCTLRDDKDANENASQSRVPMSKLSVQGPDTRSDVCHHCLVT